MTGIERLKDCIYALFDPIWGEYKCIKKQRKVKNIEECKTCTLHRSISKSD